MTEISLNILLDPINAEKLDAHIPEDERRCYSWVEYLPDIGGEALCDDIIYVTKLSHALFHKASSPDFHCVCIRDRIPDEQETEEALRGFIIVNENIDVYKLYKLLQGQLLKIIDWVMNMKECLMKQGGYQDLFDISEDILENFTSAIDVGYKLLAYTKNHLSDDPINVSLVEKGYHNAEAMKEIQRANRFPAYEYEQGIIENPPGNPTVYATISKWFRFAGNPYVHIIMICNNRPPSPCLIELFEIFLEHANIFFQRQTEQNSNRIQNYYSLFSDMAFNNLDSPRVIAERAKCINLPFEGIFDICHIVFEDNNKIPVGRFVDELFACIPGAKIIFRNYEVIVFNSYSNPASGFYNTHVKAVEKHFARYGAICGVSERFTQLSGFMTAYTQAQRAQALGYKLHIAGDCWGFSEGVYKNAFPPRHERIYPYDDIYPYLMIHYGQVGSFDVFANNPYIAAIEKLHSDKAEKGDNNARVLYIYLMSERSPTVAGKLLCMNRNNIIYRIAKIEEQLGMDLNDCEVRFRLMLAFKYWETQHINTVDYLK